MQPLVSIVIPVYNGVNYMREAIDSALNQTYENCEVIVVNDGSIDETEQVALSYGDRIRYFAKDNGGVSTALNLGIEKMEGEYFQYLPHDDVLHPQKIEKNIAAIQKSGNAMSIVWSGWNYNYVSDHTTKKFIMPYIYNESMFTYSVFPLLFSLVGTVTILLHKRYFEKVGLFDPLLYTSQDYDMWFRTFIDQKTIYINEELVNYRIHERQGTQADPEFIKNCIELSEYMLSQLSDIQITKMFGNKYRFLYYMLDFYKKNNWISCYNRVLKLFRECAEPSEGKEERKRLRNYIKKFGNINNIILYCAGKNAQCLRRELACRGISVKAYSDSDSKKTGTIIEKIPCIARNEIDNEKDLVIVTADEPDSIVEQLRTSGVKNISNYKEIGSIVYHTLPVKQFVLDISVT